VVRAVEVLREARVDPVLVVVGAAADEVFAVLPPGVTGVRNPDWASGMGSSLRAGLAAAAPLTAEALVVLLVDLPGVTAGMVRTLITDADRNTLRQAEFGGGPGHPVLLGRDHWVGVAAAAHGDSGARQYLREHRADRVPLGSAADGADVDMVSD
jgi:CTP:molybdopterin cytidylyltransferase MocA